MPKGEIRDLLSPAMLKAARALAGLDQGQLARLAGLSRKTIVLVERELPAKVDPRRRAVLERIRSLFEDRFFLDFDTGKQTVVPQTQGRRAGEVRLEITGLKVSGLRTGRCGLETRKQAPFCQADCAHRGRPG